MKDQNSHCRIKLVPLLSTPCNAVAIRGENQSIVEYKELLTLVKKWTLRWFGHVPRFSGLATTVLLGTVKGNIRRGGRKKQRWKDSIKEWTGIDFASSPIAVGDRTRRKKIVLKVIFGAPTSLQGYWIEQANASLQLLTF